MVPWTKHGCHGWSARTIYGAIGGPPCHRWSPSRKNYPGSFMMVLRAAVAYCKVQSLAVMFQFAGFDYCTPKVVIALDIVSHGRICMRAWIACSQSYLLKFHELMYVCMVISLYTCLLAIACIPMHACTCSDNS